MKTKNAYMVPALEKGLAILEKLALSPGHLRITDLHEQLGIPKTSVFMILSTLEMLQFVEKADENRYRLTMRLYSMGASILSKFPIRDQARPFLEELAGQLRMTAHLAVQSGGKVIYIDKASGPGFVQFATKVGQAIHYHLSSLGKVFAAYMDEEALQEALLEYPLIRATEHSITSMNDFRQELIKIRQQGYAIEDEECEIGVRCIGAPIFGADGNVEATLGVTSVRRDLPRERLHEVGLMVMEKCRSVEKLREAAV